MAEIRVEQKGSSKWMYYVAALIVVIAVWLVMSRQQQGGAVGQALDGRTTDSANVMTPPATTAPAIDSVSVPPPQ